MRGAGTLELAARVAQHDLHAGQASAGAALLAASQREDLDRPSPGLSSVTSSASWSPAEEPAGEADPGHRER